MWLVCGHMWVGVCVYNIHRYILYIYIWRTAQRYTRSRAIFLFFPFSLCIILLHASVHRTIAAAASYRERKFWIPATVQQRILRVFSTWCPSDNNDRAPRWSYYRGYIVEDYGRFKEGAVMMYNIIWCKRILYYYLSLRVLDSDIPLYYTPLYSLWYRVKCLKQYIM